MSEATRAIALQEAVKFNDGGSPTQVLELATAFNDFLEGAAPLPVDDRQLRPSRRPSRPRRQSLRRSQSLSRAARRKRMSAKRLRKCSRPTSAPRP